MSTDNKPIGYLDKYIVDELQRCKNEGLYRALPELIQRRKVDGHYHFILQFHASWESTKRSVFNVSPSMTDPFNPNCFSFDKAKHNEILCKILYKDGVCTAFSKDDSVEGDLVFYTYINVSPVSAGQHVFVPNPSKHYPQIYTPSFQEPILCIFDLFQADDYAIFFNSLAGWASVNHQHWHGLNLTAFSQYDHRLPVQFQPKSLFLSNNKIDVYTIEDWICHTIVFENTLGKPNRHAFAQLLIQFIEPLYKENIPFNIMINNHGNSVYLFLRTPQITVEDIGYKAAFAELSGMIIVRKEEAFQTLDEQTILQKSAVFKISQEKWNTIATIYRNLFK
ncbi:hypothetical protein WA158_001383 [Blastocystis sp. Blastoise]